MSPFPRSRIYLDASRGSLGLRPTALPASTVRTVPFISAALVSFRFVPSVPGRILLFKRILRQRQESAAVTRPLPLACQDRTGTALEPLPFI
jgi:hypothetical protein